MIDPSIITRGAERAQMQQQQNFESLGELGNSLGRMVLGRRINTLQQLGTPEEKQAYANKSIYAPQLNAQIKADKAAALQAQMVQQKHAADIGNTNAQAAERNSNVGKNIQQGVGYSLDNSGKLLAAANQALYVGTQSGDPNAVKLALNNAKKAGYFDSNPEAYNQYFATVEELSAKPEELKSFALNLQKAYALNPEKYNFATAGEDLASKTAIQTNALTNKTSAENAQLGATVQLEKIKQDGQIAQEKLSFDQAKLEAEQKKGKVLQWGDTMYMVYPDNSVKEVTSPTGQPITKTTVSPAIKQAQQEDIVRTQRVDAVLPEIKKLLEGTKGGYINASLDWLGGAAGYSTDTAKSTAQLKALSGQLVALMPKMSGPQSDKDVAMYKEMAGNLADPTTPVATRLASLETIQTLNDKYKELNGSQAKGVPYANAGAQAGSAQGGLSGAQSQGFQSLISKYTVD